MFERRVDLDDKLPLMIEAYKCGLTVEQVAFLFSAPRDSVYRRLFKAKVLRPHWMHPIEDVQRLKELGFPEDKIKKALKLRRQKWKSKPKLSYPKL